MKIALTGSRGFIGGHLMKRLLKEGHEVVEWDLRQDPPKCIKDFDIFYQKLIDNIEIFEVSSSFVMEVMKETTSVPLID